MRKSPPLLIQFTNCSSFLFRSRLTQSFSRGLSQQTRVEHTYIAAFESFVSVFSSRLFIHIHHYSKQYLQNCCLFSLFVYLFFSCSAAPQIKMDTLLSARLRSSSSGGEKSKVYKTATRSRASEVKCPLVPVYFQLWLGPNLSGTRRAHIKLNKGNEMTFSVTLPMRLSQTHTERAERELEGGPHTGV